MRILIGLSGGVDSAYAARKLMDDGMEVEGATLIMHEHTEVEDARQVCRELARMMEEMRNLALERFTEVRNLHFRIERIYTTAMDFEALERFEKKQIAALFGR